MVRYALFITSIIALSFGLGGCATLSKSECKVGDWRAIGKADGQEGRLLERFEKHKEACSSHKIKANKAHYTQGRNEGLKSYCNIQHQVNLGIKGIHYRPVCSGRIVSLLKEANAAGYKAYTIKNDLEDTLQQIRDVGHQLDAKNLKRAEKERLEDEKRRLIDQANRLNNELKRLEVDGTKTLTRKAKAFYGRS